MVTSQTLEHMNPQALRELVLSLMSENHDQKKELLYRQTKIDQLTHEMASVSVGGSDSKVSD